MIVSLTYVLTATVGTQSLTLRVPQHDLDALLKILNFNQASEVRYVVEAPLRPEAGTTIAYHGSTIEGTPRAR